MRIALVQNRTTPDKAENIRRGMDAVREAANRGANLIVFPELSFLPFFPQKPRDDRAAAWAERIPGRTTDQFSRLAAQLGVVIVPNLYERDGGRTFDASPVIDSDGSLKGVTRMIHIMEGPGFHEKKYYQPGDHGVRVFSTAIGKLGVAICYDRHYPEYMRALGLQGAEIVVVPQAGAVDEWPAGLFEAEMQVAAFQNGYFAALANRVGPEECLVFGGESFVVDPLGRILARAPKLKESILIVDLDLSRIEISPARKHFLPDWRPEKDW